MKQLNHFSTDISRDLNEWQTKDDPREGKALLLMVISALVLGIVGPMLILLYADIIDSFINTLFGAILLSLILGIIGITWAVYYIRNKFF